MEQNVGPTTAGDRELGWLYRQTNSLRQLGAKLTCSGDSPFGCGWLLVSLMSSHLIQSRDICALTVIADKEEMKEASTEIEDLFKVVWKNEVVVRPKENTDTYVKSVKVLQGIYPSLVSKVPGKTLGCITTKDASELLKKSLNECTQLQRATGDLIEYEKWAEIYYKVLVLILGEQGLTPYKLKILLMKILPKNTPWEHLCEALKKTTMLTRIFKVGQCDAEEDCITKTHFSSNCFFFILQVRQIFQVHT